MKIPRKLTYTALVQKYHFVYNQVTPKIESKIQFDNSGFRHLIRRNKQLRNPKDMRHRLSLIPLIPRILKECPEPIEIRGEKKIAGDELVPVRYYAFKIALEDRAVKMVARQVADGAVKFVSLYETIS